MGVCSVLLPKKVPSPPLLPPVLGVLSSSPRAAESSLQGFNILSGFWFNFCQKFDLLPLPETQKSIKTNGLFCKKRRCAFVYSYASIMFLGLKFGTKIHYFWIKFVPS